MAESALPFDDTRDFDAVRRGLIAPMSPNIVHNDAGDVVWDGGSYAFLDGDAPATANPSLWRQSKLVATAGLFDVVEGIYQVRGLDLSNITFIEGDTGVIVIDPLISTETAAAALALYREHRGDRPVTGVIYSHSHVDHFGGVKGVTTQEDVDAGRVPILAPEGFIGHAIAENIYAGTAMARRSAYMYGAALERSATGGIGAGLGQTVSTGTVSLIAPTDLIATTGETRTIDGVEIEFQMAPGTEAPSEMHFYFPAHRALCMAENATHTLHNLLTLRGALVRDPHIWAHYLSEAIETFGDKTDVVFASHHWPTWGRAEIVEFLGTQRDLYAYLHDQTLRRLNRGETGIEIAENFPLPPAIENAWHARGYYGSVSHNVKAVYQRYMGWYDGNPARLWQLPPVDAAKKYVEFMGGADAVVDKARASFDAGDYRWAAQVLDHVVFAEPTHAAGRELLADTLEQLGFGSENGTWRDVYLTGALELRGTNVGTPTETSSADFLSALPPALFFDALAIQIDGPNAWHLDLATRWIFPDTAEQFRVTLRNGVLVAVPNGRGDVTLTITVPQNAIAALARGSVDDAVAAGVAFDGDPAVLQQVLAVLEPGDPGFNVIEP